MPNNMEEIKSGSPARINADIPRPITRITRRRYVELTQVAFEVCEFLETKSLRSSEACVVRNIAEQIWSCGKE